MSTRPGKLSVLLVDDEPLVRQLLAYVLREAGYVVEEADNGASALQTARQMNGALGLVITDIDMPVMDGLEFARLLRQTDRRIPFLFITALDPALVTESGQQGEVLAKPFLPETLLETVARMSATVASPGQLA